MRKSLWALMIATPLACGAHSGVQVLNDDAHFPEGPVWYQRTLTLPSPKVPNLAFSPDEKTIYVTALDQIDRSPYRGKGAARPQAARLNFNTRVAHPSKPAPSIQASQRFMPLDTPNLADACSAR